jgi:hypothetical protein
MLSVASQPKRSGCPFLPFDEMRQHLARRLAVADEIVVDEIDERRIAALRQHGVELGGELLRRFQPRLPAVQRRYVAELAAIGTAAGELQRAEQIAIKPDEVIGRDGKVGQRQPLRGLESHLRGRRRAILIEQGNEPVGAVADLADVQIIEIRVHFRCARHRWTAECRHLAGRFRAAGDVVNLRRLNVHAADKDDIGPGEIRGAGRLDVLVNEADRPWLGHIGRDQQQALWRHERAHAAEEMIGVRERAERGRVGGKHAENSACIAGRQRETQSHPSPICPAAILLPKRNPATAPIPTNLSTATALRSAGG